ncbi:ephrin-A4 isoform X1 [Paramormyrops kingsleyae]|uniref:Ephrin-A4 n=1 Tax=Paramormyrops kingsleyae TaxID=1676925 RepID=A0A3B3SX48_9TELE|nr:ephrin-A4-like [Paramormyrops kingsleyae]
MARLWCAGAPSVCTMAVLVLQVVSTTLARRHAIYWNSTNTRLVRGDLSVQVDIGDYLDIYCPHYPPGVPATPPPETLALFLVREVQFRGCVETQASVKRWECNRPHAPYGPVRFSEKIQRFTPFSLGFEFLPGHRYYYMSLPTEDGPPQRCLKLQVTVCCESGTAAPHSSVSTPVTTPLLLFIFPLLLLFPGA